MSANSTAATPNTPDAPAAPLAAEKINVGILTTAPTPYRLALHRRIDREVPEVRIFSMYLNDAGDQPWAIDAGEADRSVSFGAGQRADRPSRPSEIPRDWAKAGRMIQWCIEHRIRALIVAGYSDLGRLRLLRWCRKAGVPVFLFSDSNIHLDTIKGVPYLIKRTLLKWVVRQCAGFMPCGSFGRDYFVKYGAAPDRIFYWPYEPDYSLIEQLPQTEIDRVCTELGLNPARRRMVFCARMTDFKKPDMAVEAFAAISAQRPDWDLVMIGNGPMLESVRQRVPEALRHRVQFAGFIGEQSTISAIYRASDIFLHPSVHEPWGVVINEAVCAGNAIVAARTVGAAGELLRDRVNGRAFEPEDLQSMVGALLDATDPVALERYKAASASVLADWRRRGDPVNGFREALMSARLMYNNAAPTLTTGIRFAANP